MGLVERDPDNPFTVLVVDDEPVLCEIIVSLLEGRSLTVYQAGSGHQAFEVVKKHPVDIVLSDVRMQDGSGLELLEDIIRLNPHVPAVILMTGYSDISSDDMVKSGAKAVLKKPFKKEVLLEAVTSVALSQFGIQLKL